MEVETEVTETELSPIQEIHTGECPSLSGQSTLTYAIGKDEEGGLHLAIIGNDAAGMFCSDYVSGAAIDKIVTGNMALTSSSFKVLHPHRSTNTAGFILAALAELGLVRRGTDNTRHHEHVPTASFASCVQAKFDGKTKADTKRKSGSTSKEGH